MLLMFAVHVAHRLPGKSLAPDTATAVLLIPAYLAAYGLSAPGNPDFASKS